MISVPIGIVFLAVTVLFILYWWRADPESQQADIDRIARLDLENDANAVVLDLLAAPGVSNMAICAAIHNE